MFCVLYCLLYELDSMYTDYRYKHTKYTFRHNNCHYITDSQLLYSLLTISGINVPEIAQLLTPLRPAEKMKYLLALTLLSTVLAQETFYCPDGWHLYDGRAGCSCFWLAEYESVTRDDADVLCSFHEAWVAELDSPGKAELLV